MTLPDDGWYVVAIHFETVGAKMVEPKDVKREWKWSRIMSMKLKLCYKN